MFAFTLFTILSALKRKQNYVVIYGMIPVALAQPPLAARKYLVIPSQAYSFPATVCLAIPLYEQWTLLKKNIAAVALGLTAGVITSLVTVLVLSVLMGLSHEDYVTLLPKSITTAIGMGVSEELGGYVTITVAVIVVTGVLGNILGEFVCKIFRITEPISKGLALGASSHAIGTAKAIEIGEIEGAMSSLAIAVAGILTVVFASVFANFY
jgi:putative effector of murein hydrolase